MRDLSNPGADDQPAEMQALARSEQSGLVPQGADQRTELYARLRAIIDSATESIRALKEENATLANQNAALSGRIGDLEQHLHSVTANLASDELALRRSAEVLEEVLKSPPEAMPPRDAAEQPAPPPAAEAAQAAETEYAPPVGDPSAETAPIPIPTPMAEARRAEEQAPAQESTAQVTQRAPAERAAPEPVAAPSAGMEEAPAPRIAAAPEGSYAVIAYPFVRFSDLGQFQAALQRLTGVHDVQVRRFAQGTLEMHLGYSGGTDLATTLRSLPEVEDVHEEEPSRLRVRLRTSQDA